MAPVTIGGRPIKARRKKPNKRKPSPALIPSSPRKTAAKPKQKNVGTDKGRAYVARKNQKWDQRDGEQSWKFKDLALVPHYTNFRPLDLKSINWERRMACKADPLLDLRTYMPNVFYLDWADYQKDLIHTVEQKIIEGGKKAFGCPRGGGKTAIVRGVIIRAMKYGLRRFAFFIGSREDKALQTLSFIRTFWYRSQELQQDFPELAYPIYRLEGRASLGAMGQTFKGERTHIDWGTKEVQFPTMLFDEEDIAGYLEHDPSCVIYLPDRGIDIKKFIINSSGAMIRVSGIDGSIRGEAEIHPILLTQPRPDFILLDDVQKDSKAESPKACMDLENLIESAIDYLSAPDVTQSMLMPCTVIREGDVSDTYLSSFKKPEWDGVRNGIIKRYPIGMDDYIIHDEINGKPNICGRLWEKYKEIREESYRKYGNLRAANHFYLENRKEMSEGFEISWQQRFKSDSPNPDVNEIDAIQSAMNWRFKDLESFLSEAQNNPRSKTEQVGLTLKPEEVAEKITNIPRSELSVEWNDIVAFIDVQDEILFTTIFAFDYNFNGQFIDYGPYPQIKTNYFRKSQTAGWSLLTRNYFKEYPDEKPSGVHKNRTTNVRAPFERKLYLALKQTVDHLFSREFRVSGNLENKKKIRAIAIDTQWGKSSETVKRFQREYNDGRVITYSGQAFSPHHRQIEEYDIAAGESAGWLFEHQMHPHVKEPKWIVKGRKDGTKFILADVNRLKSFLMSRLACPPGKHGCITLFQDSSINHKMFADHVADSEYPEPITARGLTKDCWQSKPTSRNDNDYLDCASGCLCLASICGASLKTGGDQEIPKKRSLKEAYAARKANRG